MVQNPPTDPENPGDVAAEGGEAETARTSGGPLGILLPPDPIIWNEARRYISNKNVRVEDVATCVSQDPALVLELLKTANALYFSAGRPPITSTRTAIVRLGSQVVIDLFDKIRERPAITDDEITHWLELHRSRCKRTAIVARIMAEALAKQLADDCTVAGALMHVGDMLAVIYFGERYVHLAEELSRSGINYRLHQDHKFDTESVCVNYLRRNGIPENILFAIERDALLRSPERAIMKPLCMAAAELVDAFDSNRWEKLAPGKKIPPKSAIRLLQMSDAQYLRIYERASEYLYAIRGEEEKKRLGALVPAPEQPPPPAASAPSSTPNELDSEIENLLRGVTTDTPTEQEEEPLPEPEPAPVAVGPKGKEAGPTTLSPAIRATYGLQNEAPKTKPRVNKVTPVAFESTLRTAKGNKIVGAMANIMDAAKNGEDLLRDLLAMLVDEGPFEKSALIVVSKDRKQALVVASRGPTIGTGQVLELNDPLSPLAQCFSRVQSFGNKESECSPFGSKAFAVAPIAADHGTPVALYADCGNEAGITFEARRVFRNVVELLNQRLPQIPGGIPVEVK